MMRLGTVLVTALMSAASLSLASEGTEPPTDESPGRPDRPLYASLFLGDFNAKPDGDRLTRSSGGYGWGLSGGYFLKRHLSLEGEFLWFRREYERVADDVIPGTADNRSRVLSLGLMANLRCSRRFSRWRPFISGGLGWFDSELFTTDPDSGLFTDVGDPPSRSSAAFQLSAGASFHLRGRTHLEIGWRRLFLDADFGPYSNGETELGGDLLYLAVRGGGL